MTIFVNQPSGYKFFHNAQYVEFYSGSQDNTNYSIRIIVECSEGLGESMEIFSYHKENAKEKTTKVREFIEKEYLLVVERDDKIFDTSSVLSEAITKLGIK